MNKINNFFIVSYLIMLLTASMQFSLLNQSHYGLDGNYSFVIPILIFQMMLSMSLVFPGLDLNANKTIVLI